MVDNSQVVAQSQRRADKAPLDGRYRFDTLEAATAEAYNGAFFFVTATKEWYKFSLNEQGALVATPDSAIDASIFALKTDLNGLATSQLATTSVDGMMSAAAFTKLAGINTAIITKVRASTTNGNVLINDTETPVYVHPESAALRHVTDTEKETWNGKAAAMHYHDSIYSPIAHNHNTLYAPLAHEHQVWDNVLGRFREKYVLADGAGSGGDATTLGGLALNNNATGVGANDAIYSATKVREIIDAKANELSLGNSWKPAVATFADIATTYPNPVDGWTVPVKDIDHSWRFNGTEWVDLGGVMPMATQSIDGKMSAADKTKLDGVAVGANNYTHPAQHLASVILEEADKRFMTDAERQKLNTTVEGNLRILDDSAGEWLQIRAIGGDIIVFEDELLTARATLSKTDHTHSDYAKTNTGASINAPVNFAGDAFALNNNPGLFFSEIKYSATNKPSGNEGAFMHLSDADGNDVKLLYFVDATTKYMYYCIQWGIGNMSPWKMVYTPDNIPSPTPLSSTTPLGLGTAAVGTATTAARADHVHTLPASGTPALALAVTASAGSSNAFSRYDHVHPLPAVATVSVNGLMSAIDKTKLDGLSKPATTVDNALVRFNGTTGTIQASTGAILSDTGVLTITDIIIT